MICPNCRKESTEPAESDIFEMIVLAIADRFNLSPILILSRSKLTKRASLPRYLAMLLYQEATGYGAVKLGRVFDREQSTVLHGLDVALRALSDDHAIAAHYHAIKQELNIGKIIRRTKR